MKLGFLKILLFGSVGLLIMAICHLIYPYTFAEPAGFFDVWRDTLQSWPVIHSNKKLREDQVISSMYRFSPERLGIKKFSSNPLELKVIFKKEGLLSGVHTASKATPVVDESGVYLGTDTGIFYKFSREGKLLWSFRTEGGQQGIHGTALVTQNAVYFGNYAGKFYCLDKKNGDLIWATQVASAVGSSPFLWNNKIFFSAEFSKPRNGFVVALDALSGKRVWSSPFFDEQVHSSPTLADDIGIIGVGTNLGQFLGIDVITGSILWRKNFDLPIKDTAFYYKKKFCFSGWDQSFRCLYADSGEEDFSVSLSGRSMSSPTVDPDTNTAYVLSASGYVFAIDLREKFIKNKYLLGDLNSVGRLNMFSPVILDSPNGKFVFTTCFKTQLCIFDLNLKLKRKIEVGGAVTGSLAVWDDEVYATIDNSGLIKIH